MIGEYIASRLNRRLVERLREAEAERDALKERNTCIAIRRAGRTTNWTFLHGSQIIQIETMSMICDDVADWCDKLGISGDD